MTTRTFCDNNGDGINDCLALGAWPGFGHAGHYVLVDPSKATGCTGNYIPPGCVGGGCFVRMIHLALHELGHTFGFHHPGCSNHIAGTATDPSCNSGGSSYSTEMTTPFNCSDNGLLKSDDITSIKKTYP